VLLVVVAELPEAGLKTVLTGVERSHLARELRYLLKECRPVRILVNAGKCWLSSNLGHAVSAEGCGVLHFAIYN
jgi:hypothetical protein